MCTHAYTQRQIQRLSTFFTVSLSKSLGHPKILRPFSRSFLRKPHSKIQTHTWVQEHIDENKGSSPCIHTVTCSKTNIKAADLNLSKQENVYKVNMQCSFPTNSLSQQLGCLKQHVNCRKLGVCAHLLFFSPSEWRYFLYLCVCTRVRVFDWDHDCVFLSLVPRGGDMVGIVIPLSFPTFERRLQACHSGGAENRPVSQWRPYYQSGTWKVCICPTSC